MGRPSSDVPGLTQPLRVLSSNETKTWKSKTYDGESTAAVADAQSEAPRSSVIATAHWGKARVGPALPVTKPRP